MNPQTQNAAPVDEDDWEPAPPTPDEWQENQEVMEAFAVQMGVPLEGPRIKPNRWIDEK